MTQPLPSWNGTPARQSILDFVATVTELNGSGFVPVPERIATFDADGTLWCEKPVQIQLAWILQRLAEMAEKDASLRTEQPFKAAHQKDDKWFSDAVTKHYNGDDSGVKVLLGGVTKAFGSMTVEAFAEQATDFFDTEQHPVYKVSYRELAYQPMVELLDYLVANGFTPYIVSGGGRDFMRPVTPQLFGIPPERVIGSAFAESYQSDKDGAHIMRGESIALIDDGPAKAVQIWDRIGRRPILAAGNANGDIPMLEFADSVDRPTLRLLVNHDDSERETDYTAGAEKAMALAHDQDWIVVSMKDDWKLVFSFQDAARGADR
jgi:phosphoglycolate phosphatase-like HAD superfamily hydrolase